MRIFLGLVFLLVICIAIFAVQNSTVPPVGIKFLLWKFETSLIYTILGSMGVGGLIILLLTIPAAIRGSWRTKDLKKEIEFLRGEGKQEIEETKKKPS